VLVKNAPGYVFSITIAYTGVTAGAKIYLRDGTSGSSPIEVMFIFPASSGTITKEWPQGKEFQTAIYYDEGPHGGQDFIWLEMTYK
jgi:hypothetical protein